MENMLPSQQPDNQKTIDLTSPPKSKFRKILKIFAISFGVFSVIITFAFIGMVIYYIINPEYTEVEILEKIQSGVMPSVVKIECFEDEKQDKTRLGTGVYFLSSDKKEPIVETNAHVVLGKGGLFYGCRVYFPRENDGSFYESTYETDVPMVFHNIKKDVNGEIVNGIDYAMLPLKQNTSSKDQNYPFPPEKRDPYDVFSETCKKDREIKIGSKVYLLGYPSVGGDSLTITEGVVSGFLGEQNQNIKISASANHGSSGGLVIGATDGCNYGILSSATFASGSNLGYALGSGFIRDFINSTDIKEQNYYVIDKDHVAESYLTNSQEFQDITLKYPKEWNISTSTSNTAEGVYYLNLYPEYEDAIDDFGEFVSVAVYKNKTIKDFQDSVSKRKKGILTLDPSNNVGSYVYLDNIKAFEVGSFADNTKKLYNVPVNGYSLLFLYKNNLYSIIGAAEKGKNQDVFWSLVKAITHSIDFK